MRSVLTRLVLGMAGAGALAAISAMTPAAFVTAAHAFTIEGPDPGNQYEVPKFDLEEQSRNFRRSGTDTSSNGNSQISTPFGKGTLQFGVQPSSSSNFGSGFSGFGPGWGSGTPPSVTRQDFERIVTPENLR
jgi:hypothetical protein